MKEEKQEAKMEDLEISFHTDWKYPEGDYNRRRDLQAEKISFYAGAIFELIEMSCEPYVPLSWDEVSPRFARHHLLVIREAAELGKHLVNNQI